MLTGKQSKPICINHTSVPVLLKKEFDVKHKTKIPPHSIQSKLRKEIPIILISYDEHLNHWFSAYFSIF